MLRRMLLLNGSRASSPDLAYTAHFKVHNSELPGSASKPRLGCGGTGRRGTGRIGRVTGYRR